MNDQELIRIIRHRSAPMAPLETGQEARLMPMHNIEAVLFDIYGTLLVSGSGDVGTAAGHKSGAIRASFESVGIDSRQLSADLGLESTIREHHERSRQQGVDYPEVDIEMVWRDLLSDLTARGDLVIPSEPCDVRRLAVEYECRVNPVWPMPNIVSCIESLGRQRVLGIVSNAQFFTPLLFPALLTQTLAELGFSPEMQYFSYQQGVGKPSPAMFTTALESLKRHGISADATLYVGNDMLNDVATAGRVGMKTALFAGDRRSLRWRRNDPRVAGSQADIVLTDLSQLTECVLE